jgi:hypothetical protein
MAQDENPNEEEQEAAVPDEGRPAASDGVTVREQREGETANTRRAREQRDIGEGARSRRSGVDVDDDGELAPEETALHETTEPDEWLDETEDQQG